VDKNHRIIEFGFHGLRIGHKVRREVAAIELHTFDNLDLGIPALGFLDRDNAILANLLHGLGNQLTDFRIVVGRNCTDLCNLFFTGDTAADVPEFLYHFADSAVDTSFQVDRTCACCNILQAFAIDRLSQNRSGCGSITCNIAGF